MCLFYSMFTAGRSCHPNLKDGGALQISVKRFQIDYYPYHLAKGKHCSYFLIYTFFLCGINLI